MKRYITKVINIFTSYDRDKMGGEMYPKYPTYPIVDDIQHGKEN